MNTGSLAAGKLAKSFVTPGSITETVNAADLQPSLNARDAIANSHDALLLTEALHTAQNASDTRPEKVAELRESIAGGSYQIDNYKLAAALLREEPQLFQL